jgi:hypothetical protein
MGSLVAGAIDEACADPELSARTAIATTASAQTFRVRPIVVIFVATANLPRHRDPGGIKRSVVDSLRRE